MKLIEKLLIANRGEIAVRILRSTEKLGIPAVCVYATPDEDALHVRRATEAYSLGDGELSDTYLNIPKILDIAKKSGCDAIHPGYGFLSENPSFASACEEAGLVFVGPGSDTIKLMGNKIEARDFAIKAGIPVTPGATGTPAELLIAGKGMKLPLLVKAAAGGGGKGMRIIRDMDSMEEALVQTSREAEKYFGNGSVYLERYIDNPRHIEVQVLGDKHGNVIHLFERECSIQRRYQKIIEESPSPTLTPEVRKEICQAAVKIGQAINYDNAGTLEFLVDDELNFYFLEMNTRVQVEHPVTEMVTGIDIVEEQILIASGNPLRYQQNDVKQKGHAIECRIYAEDPASNFLPSPGTMNLYLEPSGKDLRIDSSVDKPAPVRSFYDPMISKMITWGEDREMARHKAIQCLQNYIIHGIKTNVNYLLGVLDHKAYIENKVSTHFCDMHTAEILESLAESKKNIPVSVPLIAYVISTLNESNIHLANNVWNNIGYWRINNTLEVSFGESTYLIEILRQYGHHYHFMLEGQEYETDLISNENGRVELSINGYHSVAFISRDAAGFSWLSCKGHIFQCLRNDFLHMPDVFISHDSDSKDRVCSPMPGKVIRINFPDGAEVKKGQTLLVVEAMKMENNILAMADGTISSLLVKPGDMVDSSTELVRITYNEI
ncbi:MAG: biotin carboxylase N-terminal domain-containing protein [Bacteroidota bacterium]